MKLKKIFKIVIINFGVLLVLIVLLDFYLGRSNVITYTRNITLKEWAPNTDATYKPYTFYSRNFPLLENKDYHLLLDSNGFITTANKKSIKTKTNIIFFGGSTTECLFVDDSTRFPYLVQKSLNKNYNVKTYNAGVSGNHSLHSTINFITKAIPLKPKIVILMHNINDLTLLTKSGSYYDSPKGKQLINTSIDEKHDTRINTRFLRLRNALFPNIANRVNNKFQVNLGEWGGFPTKNNVPDSIIETEFRKSIITFIKVAEAHRAKVILMTQFNRINFQDSFLLQDSFNFNMRKDLEFYRRIIPTYHKLNQIIREVAANEEVGLIDLAILVPSNNEYIYDEVHLNNKGSKYVTDIVSKYLTENYSDYLIE